MNNVEKLIAKLIDEHKITGEEAIVLIKGCKSDNFITSDNLWKDNHQVKAYPNLTSPNPNITWGNRDLDHTISISQ